MISTIGGLRVTMVDSASSKQGEICIQVDQRGVCRVDSGVLHTGRLSLKNRLGEGEGGWYG